MSVPPRPPRESPLLREAIDLLDVVARSMARQLGGRFNLDDLKGFAHEAISEVISRFDETRGVSFRSYARLRLRGAMIDGLRRESGLPRGIAARLRALEAADLYVEEKSEETSMAKGGPAEVADQRLSSLMRGLATAYATGLVARDDEPSMIDDADREDPETHARRKQTRLLLEQALTEIGEPEGTILRRHYFLDEDLQDAAAHLGLSKSWGSRLHARGIEKLSEKLAALREGL
ncbi:MAG: RNA polymerase sigma-28 factor SigD [Polyangiales bacterium]